MQYFICFFLFISLAPALAIAMPLFEIQDIGSLYGNRFSRAYDINDKGQITGIYHDGGNSNRRAFFWDPSTGMTHLRNLSGKHQYGRAINNSSQVVGTAGILSGYPAFLWDSGTVTQIESLGGWNNTASDINDNSWVVGHSNLDRYFSPNHAFLSYIPHTRSKQNDILSQQIATSFQ